MKVAFYTGMHKNDKLLTRLGWAVIRLVQEGHYANVTHVEAILKEHGNDEYTIASASLADGGVRKKRAILSPESWLIIDVPQFDVEESSAWFDDHYGEKYDSRGAFASALPLQWTQKNQWFCNQAVGASVGLDSPEIFGPAQFASICETLSKM